MSVDPFANTTTVKNILQHVISPKIVKDGSLGYVTKTDLVNVHNLVFSEKETTAGTVGSPLTAQCGTYTVPNTGTSFFFVHSRVNANSIVIAQVIGSSPAFVLATTPLTTPNRGFSITLSTSAVGTKVGWFIVSF
jgi:hypothetical protein